jgi:hypothetical protein
MTTKSTSLQENGPVKKPYERPRLEVYGDIREVTDAVGKKSSMFDGGHFALTKTG